MVSEEMYYKTTVMLEEKHNGTEKVLPLYESPVKGLQFFVLETIFNEDKIKSWFYCNYIQLEWTEGWCINFSLLQKYYVGYLFINKQIFTRETINGFPIIDFLINNINNGWYTHLSLDEYYVPEKEFYQKEHFVHDNMICGYNLASRSFTIYGYAMHRLKVSEISFEAFEQAYVGVGNLISSGGEDAMQYGNLIFMIKKNLSPVYEMDMELLKSSLKDYLKGIPYVNRFRMFANTNDHKTYGINIIKKLIHGFEQSDEAMTTDLRLTTTIYEHSLIMAMRVRYLMDNHYIKCNDIFLNRFRELEKISLEIRNLQLYFSMGMKREEITEKIILYLKQFMNEQMEIYSELLTQMG